MTSAGATGWSSRKVVRWLLGAQIALAAALVVLDVVPALPTFYSPSNQPELDRPTSPGDQTRRYSPRNPTNPGPGLSPDMPRRLVGTISDDEGVITLHLRGAISPGDADRVIEQLRTEQPARVVLDSPGGSVADAIRIGETVRAIAADTRLAGNSVCMSACPYIFAGGRSRAIEADARFGVHQHSYGEAPYLPVFMAVDDIQRSQATVVAHLIVMGIDLRIMEPALATPANEIYILSAQELEEWNVITE